MPVWLVWTIAVVVGIVLLRALWEGSWERVRWLGMTIAFGLLLALFWWAEGWAARLPSGFGTLGSFVCGLVMLVAGILGLVFLVKMIFLDLKTLKEESQGR